LLHFHRHITVIDGRTSYRKIPLPKSWYVSKTLSQMSALKIFIVRYFKSLTQIFQYSHQSCLRAVDTSSNKKSKFSCTAKIYSYNVGAFSWLICWQNNPSLLLCSQFKIQNWYKILILIRVWVVLTFNQTRIHCQLFCFDFNDKLMAPQNIFGCSMYSLLLYFIPFITSCHPITAISGIL